MSKIGKTPVLVRQGVSVSLADNTLKIAGKKGEFVFSLPSGITATMKDGSIHIMQEDLEDRFARSLYGTVRAAVANMVYGVDAGFEKKLELSGVGYRASIAGVNLMISVGFSHPVTFAPPPGITFSVSDNVISVLGIDKSLVGKIAAQIRSTRPPEPYKGKGIHYVGERIRRKAGKAAKATGTK